MVGNYSASTGSLELRQPARIFLPISWAIAGPLNPASYFAFELQHFYFDFVLLVVSLIIPLSAGCAAALYFLRGGGFGFVTLALITILVTISICALCGPIYTWILFSLQDIGLYLSPFPLGDADEAITTSGTFIRISLLLVAVPIIPAIILLRLVAFRREARKRPGQRAA